MKIGKYEVDAHASGSYEEGFQGSVMRTLHTGDKVEQQKFFFDKSFPTMREAIEHAYEQAHLRVQNGDW